MKNKQTCLILVPHPDDEINLTAGIMDCLIQQGMYVVVVICTNGDYHSRLAEIRYFEAKKTQKILGYNELVFLGYGDDYAGEHIYNLKNGEIAVSHCGSSETYSVDPRGEYCFQKSGEHHSYTRENYKKDLKSLILQYNPDIIICNDFDSHPDHRCLSLLFEESIGELLKEDLNYYPTILKGFSYLGRWHGTNDYFSHDLRPTTPVLHGMEDQDYCYPYKWDDRIRMSVPTRNFSLFFWRSPLFRSLRATKSQAPDSLSNFLRIANPDSVYWYRDTRNIALKANFNASSGDVSVLNDFKLFDTRDIRTADLLEDGCYWTPDREDTSREIKVSFPKPQIIAQMVIYQHKKQSVKKVRLSFDNGFSIIMNCEQTAVKKINFPTQNNILSLSIQVLEGYSNSISIGEIEIFENRSFFPWDRFNFTQYSEKVAAKKDRYEYLCKITYKIFCFYLRIWIKLNHA